MTASRCCSKRFQMCSLEPRVLGGWEQILFPRCTWHPCLCPLDMRGQQHLEIHPQGRTFPCPCSACVISRAHRCAQLCSWAGHKGFCLPVTCKPFTLCTITFRAHSGDTQTQSDLSDSLVYQHKAGTSPDYPLILDFPGLIPPPAVPCLFGTRRPAPSQLSVAPAGNSVAGEQRQDRGWGSEQESVFKERSWAGHSERALSGEGLRNQRGSALGTPNSGTDCRHFSVSPPLGQHHLPIFLLVLGLSDFLSFACLIFFFNDNLCTQSQHH